MKTYHFNYKRQGVEVPPPKKRHSIHYFIFFIFTMLIAGIVLLFSYFIATAILKQENNNNVEVKENIVTHETYWRDAINHIKEYEGIHDGLLYIGYGHRRTHLDTLRTYTLLQYDSLLHVDLVHAVSIAKNEHKLEGLQSLALGMLIYQYGEGFVRRSRLAKCIENRDMDCIIREWRTFNKFRGKPHPKFNERREYELFLFINL